MKSKITYIKYTDLLLDNSNPRIREFGVTKTSKEEFVLNILWEEMAVNELLNSIVSNGFWDYEPLIVLAESGKYIAIEGNRRLAAIKILQGTYEIKIPNHISDLITKDLKKATTKIPCIIVNTREDAWQYIGFKHVNGPAKWGSYAKAQYIAEVHNNYNIPIEEIAFQIGDTNKTAQKLYQGFMVLEQGKKAGVFDYDDIQANRLYFSHLYTGLQREGIKKYISLKQFEEEDQEPVPDNKIKSLEDLLDWLYGSKKNGTYSVIKSQNPDLKHLDEVLQNKESLAALRAERNLSYAYEISRPTDLLFEENLLSAKRSLTKAKGLITQAYSGEESILRVSGSIAEIADSIYEEMKTIHFNETPKKAKRITEDGI